MYVAKEALIKKALKEGKQYVEIAKELRVSAKTIAKVAKKMNELSPREAIELFEEGESAVDVVRETNEDITKIENWYKSWVEGLKSEIEYEGIKHEGTLKEKHKELRRIQAEESIAEEAEEIQRGKETTVKHEEGKKPTAKQYQNFLRERSKHS